MLLLHDHSTIRFDTADGKTHCSPTYGVGETEFTTEERLQLVKDKLAKVMGILEKLVEKSTEVSQSGAFARGAFTQRLGSGSLGGITGNA